MQVKESTSRDNRVYSVVQLSKFTMIFYEIDIHNKVILNINITENNNSRKTDKGFIISNITSFSATGISGLAYEPVTREYFSIFGHKDIGLVICSFGAKHSTSVDGAIQFSIDAFSRIRLTSFDHL
jgi:hypothetical protein